MNAHLALAPMSENVVLGSLGDPMSTDPWGKAPSARLPNGRVWCLVGFAKSAFFPASLRDGRASPDLTQDSRPLLFLLLLSPAN